ncbi:MAG TPA: porin family protein [Lutibacter sp.]
MKKILLIISLTILTITAVKSQEKIQFGVKGGINFTNITSNELYNKEYKTGFHVGVLVEIPFGNKFSLQPEILYSTQGVKGEMPMYYDFIYPGGPAPQPVMGEYKLDYIQIPVLAKIYVVKNFSLEIGPSFNFLVNDELIYNSWTSTDIGKSFEFSGIVGLSYKIKNGFFANARYFHGFTNALDSNFSEPKNYGFSTGFGYLFK